jgi:hypothetical protein
MDTEFEGTIRLWNGTYGFIDYTLGRRIDSIFFPGKNIVCDNIGRTAHGKIEGNLVNFKILKAPHRGELRPTATEVKPLFRSDVTDPFAHREVSRVERLGPGCAYLRRQTGEQIFLHVSAVLPAFLDRFPTLRIGDAVFHGVKPSTKNSVAHATWRAFAAELFSLEEQEELRSKQSEAVVLDTLLKH